MGVQKRKPGGLKKAAAAAAPVAVVAPADNNSDTMAVELACDEGDEVGEVSAMLEMALARLDGADDAEEGALLLRGVVHESDRILRARAAASDAKDATTPLPAAFHFAYAAALFRLGLLVAAQQDDEDAQGGDAKDYFDAAIDRFEGGLIAFPGDWKLEEGLARAIIEKANLPLRNDPTVPKKQIDALVSDAAKHIQTALATLAASDLDESVSIISILIRHSELRDDAEGAKKWINVARVELNKLLQVDAAHVPTLMALGQTYMGAANDILDAGENGEDVDLAVVGKLVDESLKYLTKASEESEKKNASSKNVKLQLLLGEVFVNKANLLDEAEDEDAANEFYKKAVACFKFVEEADASALPEAFDSFLKDWESEMVA
ncbi:hypothetical protein HDU98_009266 [Podochytrium sp. JEL0797]|nr:hypothetical protein HDU98_009266 [Podochytrium sp. JEL0797]